MKAREGNLTVRVFPPNDMLSCSSRDPTESGPTDILWQCTRHIEPPPKAMLCTSGMVKFVLTPAILTKAEDCLGYPLFSNAQISVVVLSELCQLRQQNNGTSGVSPANVNNKNFASIGAIGSFCVGQKRSTSGTVCRAR
jgi:hypothetical protein